MGDPMFWTQIGIAALIAFGATFFGVFLSFWTERRRKENEEQRRFGRMLQSISSELTEIASSLESNLEKPIARWMFPLRTDSLDAVTADPLFHGRADQSLILVVRMFRIQLDAINNAIARKDMPYTKGVKSFVD